MKLHEYQSKVQFARFGIPVQQGQVVQTAAEAYDVAVRVGRPVAIKAQVQVSGRGKANGVQIANDAAAARACASEILGMTIHGLPVSRVLIEPAVDFETALFVAIINDRSAGRPALVVSAAGGMDVEDSALADPHIITRETIDPLVGLRSYQVMRAASEVNLPRELWRPLADVVSSMYTCYVQTDATLVEANPLVITEDNRLLALDGKLVIDDNALFRQSELARMRDTSLESPAETQAHQSGIAYVPLDGQVACIVNGAGLAMATMDVVTTVGAGRVSPANFLDIGGGADSERVASALRIVLHDRRVRVLLVNIFGGMTRCDSVAAGVIQAYEEMKCEIAVVARLQGTNAEIGRSLLIEADLPRLVLADTMTDAAQQAVHIVHSSDVF